MTHSIQLVSIYDKESRHVHECIKVEIAGKDCDVFYSSWLCLRFNPRIFITVNLYFFWKYMIDICDVLMAQILE